MILNNTIKSIVAIGFTFLATPSSFAAITPTGAQSNATDFFGSWTWSFDTTVATEGGVVATSQGAPCWSITPRSTGAVGGTVKNLIFAVEHSTTHRGDNRPFPGTPCPPGPPVPGEVFPNGPFDLMAGAFIRPTRRAGLGLFAHPGLGDVDIYHWTVNLPPNAPTPPGPADGVIVIRGEHRLQNKTKFPAKWSYKAKGLGGDLSVFKSFGPGTADEQIDANKPDPNTLIRPIGKRATAGGNLTPSTADPNTTPPRPAGLPVRDYRVVLDNVFDPIFTDTTLAFIVGEPGSFFQGELGLFNDFFGFSNKEYLVPMIFDANETQSLFVAVDLTQWLSFPTEFNEGDQFDFVNGINFDLPGIQVATTPFTFDPNFGFVSDNLWTGSGNVFGEIDGTNTIPEPSSSLGLLALGALGTASTVKRKLKLSKFFKKETKEVE